MDYRGVLREIADSLDIISWGIYRGTRSSSSRVNSLTLFISSILLTLAGAYSHSYILRITLIVLALSTVIVLSNTKIIMNALKTYAYVCGFTIFLGLPTLFIHQSSDVLISILDTVLSVIAASSPMIMLFVLIGLQNIIKAISCFSKSLGMMLNMFVAILPKMSRILCDLVTVRISRNIGGSIIRNTWNIITASIGDALIHTNSLAQSIALAMISRNIGSEENNRTSIRIMFADIAILTAASLTLVVGLVVLK